MRNRSLVEELARRLGLVGARTAHHPGKAELIISAWGDEPLDPPIRLAVDEDVLGSHLLLLHDDAASLWPGTSRGTGAVHLLCVHIEETVLTRKPWQADLILDPVTRMPEWLPPHGET